MPLLFLLLLHLVILFSTQFTLWPEIVVYPYLLNNGFTNYKDLVNPYFPTLPLFLASFTKLFGYAPSNFKVITYSVIIATDLIVYFSSLKIFSNKSYAYLSLLFFLFFSIPFGINGIWFDLIQTPFILASLYFFLKAEKSSYRQNSSILAASALFSIAFFIKQQAIWLAVLITVFLAYKIAKRKLLLKKIWLFIIPPILLALLTFVYLLYGKMINDFFFWVLYFPFIKASSVAGYLLLPTKRQIIILLTLLVLFLPLIIKNPKKLFLYVFSVPPLILFAYPRFDYFHLIPLLGVLAILFPSTLKLVFQKGIYIKAIYAIALLALTVFSVNFYLKNLTGVRFFEKNIIESSQNLSSITSPTDVIYFQNSPDQVFVLANRLPPKPWVDEFPWYLEVGDEQEKVLESLKKNPPKYIVFKPYDPGNKYDLGAYQPQQLVDFIDQNYKDYIQISDILWLKIIK